MSEAAIANAKQAQILFAQQPILDAELNAVAYELLFRGDFDAVDGDSASARVFLNAFDADRFLESDESTRLFVNFTRDLLFNVPPFDKRFFVIELLEDIVPTPEVIEQVRQLRAEGYTLALDDFVYTDAMKPLLEEAEIVKLDVMATSMETIAEWIPILRQYDVQLLAEKVETQDEFERCKSQGFDFYQGYFFARPKLIRGNAIGPNKASVLSMVAALLDPAAEVETLDSIISGDSGLTYKIIRLINSAAYQRTRQVDSVRDAIVSLGLERIRRLATLMALSELESKPDELRRYSVFRGLLCERLGVNVKSVYRPEVFHMLGILSCCDAYFDAPLEELVSSLPINSHVKSALLERDGQLGIVLDSVCKLQEARWDDLDWKSLESIGLTQDLVSAVYRETMAWEEQANNAEIW